MSFFDMLSYDFMQRAFIVGFALAVVLPLIGLPVTLKRLSMMGDTLAHASLAGVAIGLCFGFNPILGSIAACVIAALSVEAIISKLASYQEISTVVVLAASIGLAGIFTSLNGSSRTIGSYLFGSIITIDTTELIIVGIASCLIIAAYAWMYNRLYLSVFDPQSAELMGINQRVLNVCFALLVAIAVSIAAKTIGSLIVSSLLVIPSICAMQCCKTYKFTLLVSIVLSLVFVYSGLCLSFMFNLMPGSITVIIATATLLVVLLCKKRTL